MNEINNMWIIFDKYHSYHQLIKVWIDANYFYSNTNIFPLGIKKINHFNFFVNCQVKFIKSEKATKMELTRLEFIST